MREEFCYAKLEHEGVRRRGSPAAGRAAETPAVRRASTTRQTRVPLKTTTTDAATQTIIYKEDQVI